MYFNIFSCMLVSLQLFLMALPIINLDLILRFVSRISGPPVGHLIFCRWKKWFFFRFGESQKRVGVRISLSSTLTHVFDKSFKICPLNPDTFAVLGPRIRNAMTIWFYGINDPIFLSRGHLFCSEDFSEQSRGSGPEQLREQLKKPLSGQRIPDSI